MTGKLANTKAVARDGTCFLLVEGDKDPLNHNTLAETHDVANDQWAPPQWVQVWGKWAVWEDCTDDDYRKALKEQGL